jgi:hypothetical protein
MRFGTWNKLDLREIGIDGAKWFGWLRVGYSGGLFSFSNNILHHGVSK